MNWRPESNLYGWITLIGLLLGAVFWQRRWRNGDPALIGVFGGAMAAAFIGAKLVYFAAEGWLHLGQPDFWLRLGYGKTILGALLAGYGGAELSKKIIGYRKPTGDWFAFAVPLGIAFGRIGCLRHGCCLGKPCASDSWFALHDPDGVSRWPATPVELLFNLAVLPALFMAKRFSWSRGQLFHLYLIFYGIFRFVHEYARETPKVIGGHFTGYQLAAVLLTGLGIWRFSSRYREGQLARQ